MQSYQLKIKLNKKIKLQIGKLGEFLLKKGIYIYTGSVKKTLIQELKDIFVITKNFIGI